jgi:hypothetical protein
MDEFLTAGQRHALEKVIAKARVEGGTHREPTPDGEAYAYRCRDEICWGVNEDPQNTNLARGVVPLKTVSKRRPRASSIGVIRKRMSTVLNSKTIS